MVRLLVEGPDDRWVLHYLLQIRYPHPVRVSDHGGIEPLLDELSVFLKGTEHFGIVVDANNSIESRWAAVRDRATKAGYVMPAVPDHDGTVVTAGGRPRFGVWIMPDNRLPGILEDFVRQLVPAQDDLWPIADDAVKNIPEQQRRFKSSALLKAVVHTWLAWQEQPGTPLGAAINQRYLRPDSPLADRFVEWVGRLESIGSDQPPAIAQR